MHGDCRLLQKTAAALSGQHESRGKLQTRNAANGHFAKTQVGGQRRSSLDDEFEERYPEVARLIKALTHSDPAMRPTVAEILELDIFKGSADAATRREVQDLQDLQDAVRVKDEELEEKDERIRELEEEIRLLRMGRGEKEAKEGARWDKQYSSALDTSTKMSDGAHEVQPVEVSLLPSDGVPLDGETEATAGAS